MLEPSREYRLGDLVIGYIDKYHKRYPSKHPSRETYCTKWPDSIGCEYIRLCHNNMNTSAFKSIIMRRNANKTFGSDRAATLHLRLGDVMQFQYYLNLGCNITCRYVRPISFFQKIGISIFVGCK